MGQFLQILLDLAREYLIFWRTVYAGQRAVRWTLGVYTRDLRPGFYFFLPVIQHIETTWACHQEVDTLLQTITTSDNVSICVSANVGYEVYNAAKYYTKVYNFDSSIERMIRGIIFEVLYALTYEEIRKSVPALHEVLRDRIHAQATDWGVKIKWVRLTDFAKAPVYRVLNEVPNFIFTPTAAS